MKLVNFYATDGIHAGLVRPEGVEDLATSGLWQGPAPVAQNDIKHLATRVGQSATALNALLPLKSLRLAPSVPRAPLDGYPTPALQAALNSTAARQPHRARRRVMTIATSPKPSLSYRSRSRHSSRPSARTASRVDHRVLGRYTDPGGRPREVLALPAHAGSVLVIDRDAHTLGDRRLVAHLGADEPSRNAALICRHYLHDRDGRWCRAVAPEDLRAPGPGSSLSSEPASVWHEPDTGLCSDPIPDRCSDRTPARRSDRTPDRCSDRTPDSVSDRAQAPAELMDRNGCALVLGTITSRLSIPELRWLRLAPAKESGEPRPVSLREVVACLESYEPVRSHTVGALTRHREDPAVSVAVLRAELQRLDASRIVLNRGLRRAVLSAVQTQGLSMSEIAFRCGRVKHDSRGNASGETSWLARRVGISPEGGEREPTPWIHSEVLALIARAGLGISPREVELG